MINSIEQKKIISTCFNPNETNLDFSYISIFEVQNLTLLGENEINFTFEMKL